MSPRKAPSLSGWIARQKRAAERVRREVMGFDGSLEHPYFRAYSRLLRSYRDVSDLESLATAARGVDLVFVADFHALPASPRLAADLLQRTRRPGDRLALGVEFVYTRQQPLLDRRQSGEIDDETFLKRLHYVEEWGYPWEGYRDLLDCARRLGVPVHALDAAPRGGFDGLERRDRHASRRIASIFRDAPGTRLLVLFGESHLAPSHLPRSVSRALKRTGLDARSLLVFQNPDRLHWQLVSEEQTLPVITQVDDRSWAVFHTPPLEKYEAYRQVLEGWRGDATPGDEIDLTPAVHDLIGLLLRWIGVRPDRHRVTHRAGWAEALTDAYPEVYSGGEAVELLAPILTEQRRSPEEIAESRRRLRERGALYDSRSNTMFLTRYLPGPTGGEGARFVRAALTGRLFIAPDEFTNAPAASTYGAAFNEALSYMSARLVDPTTVYPGETGRPTADGGSVPGLSSVEAWQVEVWMTLHRRYEHLPLRKLPAELREALHDSRPLRRQLAHELGLRLGRVLYRRVRDESLDQRVLRRLFSRPLRPNQAENLVLRLLRGDGPPA